MEEPDNSFGGMFSEEVVPSSCEILQGPTPERVDALKAKGHDPIVRRIQIFRWAGGKRVGVGGQWPVEGASQDWLASQFGGGQYEIRGVNAQGLYICSSTVNVEGPASGIGAFGARAPNTLEQVAVEMLKSQLVAPRNDPMRDAMAEMMKMMALGMQQSQQAQQAQQQMMTSFLTTMATLQKPGTESEGRTFELLKVLLAERNNAPAAAAGPVGSITEAFELVKLGLSLGAGVGKDKDDESVWLKHLAPIIESLGPGLVVTVAQALLPPEKSELVVKTVEQHLKTRQAEAAADAADPIDTDGREV